MDEFAPPKPCSNGNKKSSRNKNHINYNVGFEGNISQFLWLTEYWFRLFVCCLKTYQQYSSFVTAVALTYTQRIYQLRSTEDFKEKNVSAVVQIWPRIHTRPPPPPRGGEEIYKFVRKVEKFFFYDGNIHSSYDICSNTDYLLILFKDAINLICRLRLAQ